MIRKGCVEYLAFWLVCLGREQEEDCYKQGEGFMQLQEIGMHGAHSGI